VSEVLLPPHGHMPDARMRCTLCGDATPIAILQRYGARCSGCYRLYLAGPAPAVFNRGQSALHPDRTPTK